MGVLSRSAGTRRACTGPLPRTTCCAQTLWGQSWDGGSGRRVRQEVVIWKSGYTRGRPREPAGHARSRTARPSPPPTRAWSAGSGPLQRWHLAGKGERIKAPPGAKEEDSSQTRSWWGSWEAGRPLNTAPNPQERRHAEGGWGSCLGAMTPTEGARTPHTRSQRWAGLHRED